LIQLREKGKFKGKITIHTMINEKLIPRMYALMVYFEKIGIDMVFLCFPWFINDHLSSEMDDYFQNKFAWLDTTVRCEEQKNSWHAFKYQLSPSVIF